MGKETNIPDEIISLDSINDNNIIYIAEDLNIDPEDCNPINIDLGYSCNVSGGSGSSTTEHNNLNGLQGGNQTERYHLSKDKFDAIVANPTASSEDRFIVLSDLEDLDVPEHNGLEGLQGGNETERYHIDANTADALNVPSASASNRFATMEDIGESVSGVSSLNGLTGDISLIAGTNITIDVNSSENKLTLSSTGGTGTRGSYEHLSFLPAITIPWESSKQVILVTASAFTGRDYISTDLIIEQGEGNTYADIIALPFPKAELEGKFIRIDGGNNPEEDGKIVIYDQCDTDPATVTCPSIIFTFPTRSSLDGPVFTAELLCIKVPEDQWGSPPYWKWIVSSYSQQPLMY